MVSLSLHLPSPVQEGTRKKATVVKSMDYWFFALSTVSENWKGPWLYRHDILEAVALG